MNGFEKAVLSASFLPRADLWSFPYTGKMDILFESPLPPEEYLTRLKAAVGNYRYFLPDFSKPFVGKIEGGKIQIRGRAFHQVHALTPVFFGSVRADPASGRTIIEGRFGLDPLTSLVFDVAVGWSILQLALLALAVVGVSGALLIGIEIPILTGEGGLFSRLQFVLIILGVNLISAVVPLAFVGLMQLLRPAYRPRETLLLGFLKGISDGGWTNPPVIFP